MFVLVVYMAHRVSEQSGAEKDGRLLFREKWILLFSKAKMATTNLSQSDFSMNMTSYAN